MFEFFKNLFNTDQFPARWHCGVWESGHGWLHIISDTLIFGAYLAIPCVLVFYAWKRQREILFEKIVLLFAVFILSCGVGHLIEATIFWKPWYRFSGLVKAVTATVSWITVIAIIYRLPTALKLPGIAAMNRRLENVLAEKEDTLVELARRNKELDSFAYAASHDLKAPLRSIRNLAEWVEEDCRALLPEESQRHLLQIQARVDRLDTLMSDLLRYAQAGREIPVPEEVDVGALGHQIFDDMAGCESRFSLKVAEELPAKIVSWRIPLEQILRNLIGNAVKHHKGETGTITLSGERVGDEVVLAVSDDGPGINPSYHERIFGMFQSLQSKDEIEGSGIGLALVKKLTERLGGDVTVRSDRGEGATFAVRIPEPDIQKPGS